MTSSGTLDAQYQQNVEARTLSRERIGRGEFYRRQGIVEWVTKGQAKEAALASLAEIQATRPLKPPGRQ